MIMKKGTILAILLIAALFISSCNSNKNVQQQDNTQPTVDTSSDGSPNLLTDSDLNLGLDNNNLNNINDPTLDPNSLG